MPLPMHFRELMSGARAGRRPRHGLWAGLVEAYGFGQSASRTGPRLGRAMSSLFDDSFLADLQPSDEEHPPPPRTPGRRRWRPGAGKRSRTTSSAAHSTRPAPQGRVLPGRRPAPAVDPAALLEGLNERAARRRRARRLPAAHRGRRRFRQDPGADPPHRAICSAPAGCTPARSSRSPSPTRPRGEMKERVERAGRPARQGDVGHRPSTARACGSCAASRRSSASPPRSRSTTRPTPSG